MRTAVLLSVSALALVFFLRSAHAWDGGVGDASPATSPVAMDSDVSVDASSEASSEASIDAGRGGDPTLRPARCPSGNNASSRAFLQVQREVTLECPRDFRECSGTIEARVEHCGTGVVRMHIVALLSAAISGYGTYPVVVTPGESRAVVLPFQTRNVLSSVTLLARITHADGAETHVSSTVLLRNPARERAQRECRACRGDWGRHGMLGYEGCICRTRDAGRRCTDGADCQGICLRTGAESVVTHRCPRHDCIETYDIRAVGRCSEFVAQFGCYSYIPVGARARARSEGLSLHSACAD